MWSLRPEHFRIRIRLPSPSHPSPNSAPSSATWTTWTGASVRYIDAKQKLIGLLEEEKQAIINQAVTRGLDPNVRLKPSGVEWLGDVPEHWEVVQLGKWYSNCSRGTDCRSRTYVSDRRQSIQNAFQSSQGNGVLGRCRNWQLRGCPVLAIRETIGALCGNVHFIEAPRGLPIMPWYCRLIPIQYRSAVRRVLILSAS